MTDYGYRYNRDALPDIIANCQYKDRDFEKDLAAIMELTFHDMLITHHTFEEYASTGLLLPTRGRVSEFLDALEGHPEPDYRIGSQRAFWVRRLYSHLLDHIVQEKWHDMEIRKAKENSHVE